MLLCGVTMVTRRVIDIIVLRNVFDCNAMIISVTNRTTFTRKIILEVRKNEKLS